MFPAALHAFLSAHSEDGCIPGRSETANELHDARSGVDEARIFSACYHTTVVSVLLQAQLLEHAR
jgi:hypothetical protein